MQSPAQGSQTVAGWSSWVIPESTQSTEPGGAGFSSATGSDRGFAAACSTLPGHWQCPRLQASQLSSVPWSRRPVSLHQRVGPASRRLNPQALCTAASQADHGSRCLNLAQQSNGLDMQHAALNGWGSTAAVAVLLHCHDCMSKPQPPSIAGHEADHGSSCLTP